MGKRTKLTRRPGGGRGCHNAASAFPCEKPSKPSSKKSKQITTVVAFGVRKSDNYRQEELQRFETGNGR